MLLRYYYTVSQKLWQAVAFNKHGLILVILGKHHRNYLKANKVSKSEGIRNVECTYHLWKYADTVYPKLSQSVRACRNYSLVHLFWDTVYKQDSVILNLHVGQWWVCLSCTFHDRSCTRYVQCTTCKESGCQCSPHNCTIKKYRKTQ